MDGSLATPGRAAAPQLPVMEAIAAEAGGLGALAHAIDKDALYPEAQLRALGAAGAFGLHLAAHSRLGRPSLAHAIEAMAAISAACMSSGFCAWCQDSAAWYLEQTENAALRARLQPAIAEASLLAGTGLSNPVKALSALEAFRLRGQRVAGGYIVSGILPWVSNLGAGHWMGAVFEDAADPAHRVMAFVEIGQPGVAIRQNAHFVALEGTATYSVLFRRAFIADEALLADPLEAMMARIRPGFILLQTGMGLGVIDAAVALMHEADATQGPSNTHLPLRSDDVAAQAAALRARIAELAGTPCETAREYTRAVLQARLAVSELALDATRAAALHWGACGYLEGSAVDRRLREAWFVAIITPSIRHLRQEIAALSGH